MTHGVVPVIAGLVIGILPITIITFVFRPATKTDAELIESANKLEAVKLFLSKSPDAELSIERYSKERTAAVVYSIEGQRCQPTGNFGDDCIKTLRLSTAFEPGRSVHSILICGGPISYDYGGDIIKDMENNDCFSPPRQFSSPAFIRVPVEE